MTPDSLVPGLDGRTVTTALRAGIAADVTWEVWARLLRPLWVGGPLEPAALVQSVFGLESRLAAELVHLVVGFVFYPLGYLFIARPLARWFAPWASWWLVALGYGVGLWIFALYVMAHLIAGDPAFLEFIPLTWVSLGGHLAFALVLAWVVRWREGWKRSLTPRTSWAAVATPGACLSPYRSGFMYKSTRRSPEAVTRSSGIDRC